MSSKYFSTNKPYKNHFKVCFSDFYTRKSHLDCYHLYEQYEDYFKTTRVIDKNYIVFATIFFNKNINFC